MRRSRRHLRQSPDRDGRGSTHIATTSMGLTSSSNITATCKLQPNPPPVHRSRAGEAAHDPPHGFRQPRRPRASPGGKHDHLRGRLPSLGVGDSGDSDAPPDVLAQQAQPARSVPCPTTQPGLPDKIPHRTHKRGSQTTTRRGPPNRARQPAVSDHPLRVGGSPCKGGGHGCPLIA